MDVIIVRMGVVGAISLLIVVMAIKTYFREKRNYLNKMVQRPDEE